MLSCSVSLDIEYFGVEVKTKNTGQAWETAMKTASDPSSRPLRGIASLFDDFERKELFKKYLFFLIWLEVLIFAACWIYQLGDGQYDASGPVDLPFPWRTYFLIAFLAPVAVTFLLGVIIVGFNKYFGEVEPSGFRETTGETADPGEMGSGRLARLNRVVSWVQRLPFLALLLLLAVVVGISYKIDAIVGFVGTVGETTVKFLLFSAVGLIGVVSLFLLILILLNYQLRKKSMEYQYRSEVAQRFGLIILEDMTVLNSEGKLLINGKKAKGAVPMLPSKTSDHPPKESIPGVVPRPVDAESA